ncbi:MAG: MBL fold metallo-hydrolase [Desulfohalobiaceae bacterium]|nr:MBL fold metallo-hydrolase [Desulfohalobiaceae bacterium]
MGYTITTMLSGVPVESDRGALGWSSVVLLEGRGQRILFDTGSYGDRPLLLQRLESQGLCLEDIDALVISHFHFDHMVNIELLTEQQLFLHSRELDYIKTRAFAETGDPFVPLTHVRLYQDRLIPVEDGQILFPGLRIVHLPGHTPGTMGLYLEQEDILLTSDAVKNAADFLQGRPPPCFYSETEALKSYDRVRSLTPHILPGHDREFILGPDGRVEYQERSEVNLDLQDDPYGSGRLINII